MLYVYLSQRDTVLQLRKYQFNFGRTLTRPTRSSCVQRGVNERKSIVNPVVEGCARRISIQTSCDV